MASITVQLKVWRQAGPKEKGEFKTYTVETDTDTSFPVSYTHLIHAAINAIRFNGLRFFLTAGVRVDLSLC